MQNQFNYQSFLTYIVLALIVAIMIHLLFKMFYAKRNENMSLLTPREAKTKSCNLTPTTRMISDGDDDVYSTEVGKGYNGVPDRFNSPTDPYDNRYNNYDDYNSTIESDIKTKYMKNGAYRTRHVKALNTDYNDNLDSDSYVAEDDSFLDSEINQADQISGVANRTPNYSECTSCENENTYEKEFLLNNNEPCPANPQKYSRTKLQEYRDSVFNFRNKINQTSHGVDAVDIINEKYLSNNGEIGVANPNAEEGQKICDVYDAMTADQFKQQNNILPKLDNINMSPQFKAKAGNASYYTKDNWVYKQDRVMNGGAFIDDVVGYGDNNINNSGMGMNSDMDYQMAVNYN